MRHSDVPTTLERLIEAFADHQRRTRGLRDRTLQGYTSIVRPLLRDSLGEDPIDVGELDTCHIAEFAHAMSGR